MASQLTPWQQLLSVLPPVVTAAPAGAVGVPAALAIPALGVENIGVGNFLGIGNIGNNNGNAGFFNFGNGNDGNTNFGSGNAGFLNIGSGNEGSGNLGFGASETPATTTRDGVIRATPTRAASTRGT